MVRIIIPVLLASSLAAAESIHVRAEHCAALDSAELDRAVGREVALDLALSTRARNLVISLECPDGQHAYVHVEPGSIAAEVDLDDEPAALRTKLVALAIAELIVAVDTKPVRFAAIRDDENPPPIVVVIPKRPKRDPILAARAGIRVFADEHYPMASMATDLELKWIQIGVVGAIGERHIYTSAPYLFAASIGHRVRCSTGSTSLCMVARGEAGVAGVSTYEDPMAIAGKDLRSFYADLTMGIEVRRQLSGCQGLADLELGFAHGLVVDALSLVHLNGPFATAGVGVQW